MQTFLPYLHARRDVAPELERLKVKAVQRCRWAVQKSAVRCCSCTCSSSVAVAVARAAQGHGRAALQVGPTSLGALAAFMVLACRPPCKCMLCWTIHTRLVDSAHTSSTHQQNKTYMLPSAGTT